MTRYQMTQRLRSLAHARSAALALVSILCIATMAQAVGLTYVDAVDQSYGTGPPPTNLFRSNGTPLDNTDPFDELNPLTITNTTNVWGWRSFGVPSGGFSTIYEAQDENAPEIQMRLTGLAPGNYDVYVVYWSDRASNWNIRAGMAPHATTPLTIFDRTAGNAGAIAGTLASSAAWTLKPGNNTDVATDDNPSPFIDHTPAAAVEFTRDMYLGRVGQNIAAVGGQINVWLDDLALPGAPATAGGGNRSWIEGLAYIPANTPAFVTATLDRNTGNLTVNNPTSENFVVASYSITSAAGSLNATQWLDQTHDLNALNDPNPWALTSPANCTPWPSCAPASNTALTEAETPAVNGLTFPATTGTWNFGNIWRRTPTQDVSINLTLTSGDVVVVTPTYTGTAITAGDFTGPLGTPDGSINHLDYLALVNGLHVNHATRALAYAGGDINLNGVVDRNDVAVFRNAYNITNGSGAFELMLQSLSVPEPSTVLLGAMACSFAMLVRRSRRVKTTAVAAVALVLAGLLAGNADAQSVPVINWSFDTTNPFPATPAPGQAIVGADTNSPSVTLNNANANVWANMPVPVALVNGQELVMSGRVTITGINANEAGGFRWGFFNDGFPYNEWATLDPPPTNLAPATRAGDTAGWVGYLANNSAGGPNGRLEAKNPDDAGFFDRSHMSTFGGQTANFAGPCNNPATTTATGNANPGCGGAVFNLASGGPNTAFQDGTYDFQIVVGRYGEEVTVSASLQEQGPGADYSFFLGGGIDHNGRPPAGYNATNTLVVPRPHLAFQFNRVAVLFGATAAADQANFQNVVVTPRPIESLTLEIDLANNGAARFINNSTESFDMVYYEITSESGALKKNTWDPFDPTPTAPADGIGWNVAGGSSNSVLSEVNFALGGDFNTDGKVDTADYVVWRDNNMSQAAYNLWRANFGTSGVGEGPKQFGVGGAPEGIGSIFNTSGDHDLRFFFMQSDGSTFRGIVSYVNGPVSTLTTIPEPTSACLLAIGALLLAGGRRRELAK